MGGDLSISVLKTINHLPERFTRKRKMIRNLNDNDIDNMKDFLELCHKEMKYINVGIGFDFERVKAYINDNDMIGLVEDDNGIKGISMCLIIKEYIGGNRIAIEAIWHSHPELKPLRRMKIMKNLLVETMVLLKEKGIKYFHINTSVKYPVVSKLLEKSGFSLTELHYVGRI